LDTFFQEISPIFGPKMGFLGLFGFYAEKNKKFYGQGRKKRYARARFGVVCGCVREGFNILIVRRRYVVS